jgi:SAM-dependent methyltransferase
MNKKAISLLEAWKNGDETEQKETWNVLEKNSKIAELISENGGINLDIGCGANKQVNFVGMDIRPLDGVDIVHNISEIPWPLPDGCVLRAIMSHVFEHINPADGKVIEVMNEIWRVMKPGGQLAISMPYGWSYGYIQDPTHCNPANEATWQYFDPRFPLYQIYQPKPWIIAVGFPSWQVNGNMEVLLEKQ